MKNKNSNTFKLREHSGVKTLREMINSNVGGNILMIQKKYGDVSPHGFPNSMKHFIIQTSSIHAISASLLLGQINNKLDFMPDEILEVSDLKVSIEMDKYAERQVSPSGLFFKTNDCDWEIKEGNLELFNDNNTFLSDKSYEFLFGKEVGNYFSKFDMLNESTGNVIYGEAAYLLGLKVPSEFSDAYSQLRQIQINDTYSKLERLSRSNISGISEIVKNAIKKRFHKDGKITNLRKGVSVDLPEYFKGVCNDIGYTISEDGIGNCYLE